MPEYDGGTIISKKNTMGKLDKKEDSGILSKFGTLTRRKKSIPPQDNGDTRNTEDVEAEEAELVEREGRDAIESCLFLPQPNLRFF